MPERTQASIFGWRKFVRGGSFKRTGLDPKHCQIHHGRREKLGFDGRCWLEHFFREHTSKPQGDWRRFEFYPKVQSVVECVGCIKISYHFADWWHQLSESDWSIPVFFICIYSPECESRVELFGVIHCLPALCSEWLRSFPVEWLFTGGCQVVLKAIFVYLLQGFVCTAGRYSCFVGAGWTTALFKCIAQRAGFVRSVRCSQWIYEWILPA